MIDIVCYRRHGHNEADQPSFTQPLMYAKIAKQKAVNKLYADRLKDESVVDQVCCVCIVFRIVMRVELCIVLRIVLRVMLCVWCCVQTLSAHCLAHVPACMRACLCRVFSARLWQAWIDSVHKEYETKLAEAFDNAPEYSEQKPEYFGSYWNRHLRTLNYANPKETGLDIDSLREIGVVGFSWDAVTERV